MLLIDTDIATLLQRGTERVVKRLAAADPERVALTQVTRLEILRGRIEALLKAADGDALLRARRGLDASEAFIASHRVVLLDEAAAERFDQLRANKKLNKMSVADRLQAAIALANDATLVTRNAKDYANVPGLTLEDWAA